MNIWAHRGCSYKYPENTLSAFKAACEYEIVGIELDIHLSKDGELVVIHDEKVDRTTDGQGEVVGKTLTELKELHIVANEESGLAYETIPTMREVFELLEKECKERGLLINIELKNNIVRYEGMEEKILALVKEFGLESYIIYSSFNPDSLKLLKELDSSVKTGTLVRKVSRCLEVAERIQVDALHPYIKEIDVENLKNKTTLPVRAWNTKEYEPFFPDAREIEVQNLQEIKALGITDMFTNAPELYVEKRKSKEEIFFLEKNWKIHKTTGLAERTEEACCSTLYFQKAIAGSRLKWKNPEYEYQLFYYALKTWEGYIYTYCYQQEENWSTYIVEDSVVEWSQGIHEFKEPGCFRICVRKRDGKPMEYVPKWQELFEFEMGTLEEYIWQEYFQKESRKTAEEVQKLKTTDSFTILLLTDSHYTNFGTWEDTAYNLKKTAEQVYPDVVIHLGDLTDGMVPVKITKEYSSRIMRDLNALGAPVYICLGNHDSNYFRKNPEEMTEQECSQWYLNRTETYYYVDVTEKKLRMLFLFSFDQHETIRYGFPVKEVEWVKQALEDTPEDYQILVFSHVPPLPEIHFWSDAIRNGEEMMKVLEEYHTAHNGAVIAYIHGHNHAEQIYTERAFPIISIGCNKLEDFKDKKPDGSYTCDRKRGTVTQDLWDVLVLNQVERKMDFVRFGAGEDRDIRY